MNSATQTSTVNDEAQPLLDAISRIGPQLASLADGAEQRGELAPEAVRALQDIGATRLFQPRSLGGLETSPVTCALAVEAIARYDPAAAWFLMVSNVSRFIAARWPTALVERMWGDDPDTIIAASANRPLRCTRDGDGLHVSGRVGFASGINHAAWFGSPAITDDGHPFMVLIPRAECDVQDNWDTLGMRGTGSHDVAVDTHVGPDLMVDMATPASLGPHFGGPLYRSPSRIVFATYVPISLTLAALACEHLTVLALDKTPYASDARLARRSLAQIKYGKALARQRSARLYFMDALGEAWTRTLAGETYSDTDKAALYLSGTHAVQSCAEAVQLVIDAAATSAIYRSHPLERILRDMEVLRHHGFTNESRYGSVAQVYWGADLDYPLMLR